MFHLLRMSIMYNLSAHASNLPNLIAGTLGMLSNNILFLTGIWGMLFAGKPQNDQFVIYFIVMNAIIMLAWGAINFFFGGWIDLADLIVNGSFESKLATPRHPLVLVATHNLHPSALGDLIMGLGGVILLFAWGETSIAFRTLIASCFAFIGLFATYIFAGSLAFYISRGNALSRFIREIVVSMSSYPMGKMFPNGTARILLLLSPAAAVSVVPLEWIEQSGWLNFGRAALWNGIAVAIAMLTYSYGVKRYQSTSLIGSQT